MNSLNKVNDEWVPLQAKVFTRWVSSLLKRDSKPEVKDVTKDLSNGVALIELAEILTHKKASRAWIQNPKNSIGKVQNCDLALDMFSNDGVKLVGISGKDISDNNEKLIFGLIWSLILHYFIGTSINYDRYITETTKVNNDSKENNGKTASNAQNELITWANERTSNYENIQSFEPYDLSMCALLDSYCPEKVNYKSLKVENHSQNAQKCVDVMNDLGIPCFIYPEDLEKSDNKVDRMTLLTQLAAAKTVLDAKQQKVVSEEQQKEAKLMAEEDSKIRAEKEAVRSEEDEKIRTEERAIAEFREKQKLEEEERSKAEQKEKEKAQEEAKLRAEEQEKLMEKQAAEREAKIRAEQQAIIDEEDRLKAEEESRLKADEEALTNADIEMTERYQKIENENSQKESDAASKIDSASDSSDVASRIDAASNSEVESKLKAEEEARIKAEQRAEKAEQEKRELEEKLQKAEEMVKRAKLLADAEANAKIEEEKEKLKQQAITKEKALEVQQKLYNKNNNKKAAPLSVENVVHKESEIEKPKDKHVRIRIKVHAKNQKDLEKKLKVGIRIRDNTENPDGKKRRMVCKNLKVTTRRNGEVIPSEIDGPVQNDGEIQKFHVKLL